MKIEESIDDDILHNMKRVAKSRHMNDLKGNTVFKCDKKSNEKHKKNIAV